MLAMILILYTINIIFNFNETNDTFSIYSSPFKLYTMGIHIYAWEFGFQYTMPNEMKTNQIVSSRMTYEGNNGTIIK